MKPDRAGRDLPEWQGCQRIQTGEFFAMNWQVEGSLDGRYFGLLSTDQIISRSAEFSTIQRGLRTLGGPPGAPRRSLGATSAYALMSVWAAKACPPWHDRNAASARPRRQVASAQPHFASVYAHFSTYYYGYFPASESLEKRDFAMALLSRAFCNAAGRRPPRIDPKRPDRQMPHRGRRTCSKSPA